MVGWHHQLIGYEFEQTSADGEGQGSLACCSPRGRKKSDTTERLKSNIGLQWASPVAQQKESACQRRRCGFDPGLGRSPEDGDGNTL